MNKKKLFILIGVWIVLLVIFILSLIFLPKNRPQTPSIYPTIVPDYRVPTAPPTPIVTKDKIIVNGIPVANFYATAQTTNTNGDALLVSTANYQISYLKQFEQFKISILSSDFEEARGEAEVRFLNLLSIDKSNVCRLNVEISSPQYANNKYAGMVFPLSYCVANEF